MNKPIVFCFLFIQFFGFSQDPVSQKSENSEIDFEIIEHVPVFPGCDDSMNSFSLKKCFSEKISTFISKKFNTDILKEIESESDIIKSNALFKINENGEIIDIKVNSHHEVLKNEIIRVINLLPKMKPGTFNGKPVVVPYHIPLSFKNQNNTQVANLTFPVYKRCDKFSTNEDVKKCTTNKILDFVQLTVDLELASQLFPTEKSTQFQASFIIDKKGKVKNIEVKAHKREMAIEAIRAIKRLPKFKTPGLKNGEPIETPFSLMMTIYF